MINAVLFDLDGTLLDTAPDMVGALNYVRDREGMPPVAIDEYKHFVSRGALGLISAGMPESSRDIYEKRRATFLEFYRDHLDSGTRPFDGIEELLGRLERRGVKWGVITNKPEYLALPLLRNTGLLPRAGCVVCGDTLQQGKPHPAPVMLGCEILGAGRGETLMVGDDARDLQAGRGAGTQVALAVYGYVEPGLVERERGGVFLVHRPSDVLDFVIEQGSVP